MASARQAVSTFAKRLAAARMYVEYTPWAETLPLVLLPGMRVREIFAKNLRRLRTERGLSQEETAHRAGIDRTYVSALERCVYAVSIDVLEQLAKALDVEAAELLVKPSKATAATKPGRGKTVRKTST
jgi:ribosome-binding protein aMBF1 (putative translation factor)